MLSATNCCSARRHNEGPHHMPLLWSGLWGYWLARWTAGRRSAAIRSTLRIAARCAPREVRSGIPSLARPVAASTGARRRCRMGCRARCGGTGLSRIHRPAWPRLGGILRVGTIVDRRLLCGHKLMKGFIGSANIDTNSRLCMSSAVAAHKRAFGEDLVPTTYEDLELAELIVLVGSNLAWCHPVLYQRIRKVKELRPSLRVVVIDPRRTPTCDTADLHLPLRAGTDVTLFNGLLSWLAQHRLVDRCICRRPHAGRCAGTAGGREHRRRCGGGLRAVRARHPGASGFLRMVREHRARRNSVLSRRQSVLIRNGQGQQHHQRPSIDGANRPAGYRTRFPLPANRMRWVGGEVGGLANTLAAHMELENAEHRRIVRDFLGCAANRGAARPQSRGPVRGDASRPDQGGLDHRHQSGGQSSERRSRA